MRIDAIRPHRPYAPALDLVTQRWAMILGFALLAIPTMLRLADQVWSTDEGMHGIIVLATGLWLVGRERAALERLKLAASPVLFWTGMTAALLVYIFGRAFNFISLETAALLGVGVALIYLSYGARAVRHLWFPIVYLAFVIPPPGWIIDGLTAPLKTLITVSAAAFLEPFGYPIVREGVMIYIDQYQLLVEDACAGLNSIVSLTAIGLFYIYLLHRASWRYSLFLLCWILPMAVLANFVRVLLLVLITYHWGDAAAQGFLHSTAGLLMFITALAGIFIIDGLAGPIRRRLARKAQA